MKKIDLLMAISLLGMAFVAQRLDAQTSSTSLPSQPPEWSFEHRVLQDYFTDPDAMNGECAIVDIDGDGHADLWWSCFAFLTDTAACERQKNLYQMAWYKGPDFNQMYRMHKGVTHGGNWCDINGDGRMDLVTGLVIGSHFLVWLENPGNPVEIKDWPMHVIHQGDIDPDMILFVDLDHDGHKDIVVQSLRNDVYVLLAPDDPVNGEWEICHIGHSEHMRTGASIGDVDGDGDIDVVWGHGWLENPGDHKLLWKDHIIDSDFGYDAQSVVVDLDKDGHSDVILASEEGFDGAAWYNWDAMQKKWIKHQIVPAKAYSGLHSLRIADFDGDGDMDVFTAEMAMSGYIKQEPPHKVAVWENIDIRKNNWKEHVIAETGSHNARVGDINGDGLPDIIGSNWNNRVKECPLKAEIWINRFGKGLSEPGSRKLTLPPVKLPLDQWTYIQVDSIRGKWGDFAQPDWLKYFGLSAFDVNGDRYLDIISGRYFYSNPGGDMTGHWERTDLGRNVDALLFVDVDSDKFADCIATALPDVYWFEAQDKLGTSWKGYKIGEVPATSHVNGQGFTLAQIVPGGRPEIVLSTGNGIYYLEIPSHPSSGNWPVKLAAGEASEQGLAVGDVDGDGLIDIAAPYGHRVEPRLIAWWKNPGRKSVLWKLNVVGKTANYSADRMAVADLNGDGRADILVTEESWQSQERVAQLFCFDQGGPQGAPSWERRTILTAGSLNSLDVADLDRDGDLDLVTCEHKGRDKRLFVLENDGKGLFTEHVIDHGKESHLGTLLFDMDGDGDLDIVSIAWDDYRFLHLWRNDAQKLN